MQVGVESARAVANRRIFVVDDDEIRRTVLQFILHDENETHELASVTAAIAKGSSGKPNLVLLSSALYHQSGGSAVRELAQQFPGVRIVVVGEKDAAVTCAGIHGAITGRLTVESVRSKVDAVLEGRNLINL